MADKKIQGIYIPMVTPFNALDESINYDGAKQVVDFLIQNGVDGIIPCGSTGEIIALTMEEQMKMNDVVVKYTAGRVSVFCSTGAYRTADAVELSKAAEASGADGVMVVTPWYMAPNDYEIYQHYKAIRSAISIPIMMYHNPYYTTCLLSDEFIARLYNEGIINAIKERQADPYRQQDLRWLTDDGFGLFYGYDICPVECLSCWTDGWVCGTGNLFPAENVEVYRLAKAQKMEEAKKAHFDKIRPYLQLFTQKTPEGYPTPWLSLFKEGLKLRGIDAGVSRKPVLGITYEVREQLVNVLKSYGYVD